MCQYVEPAPELMEYIRAFLVKHKLRARGDTELVEVLSVVNLCHENIEKLVVANSSESGEADHAEDQKNKLGVTVHLMDDTYERGNITPRPITPTFGYRGEPTQCRFVASRRPPRRLLVTSRGDVGGLEHVHTIGVVRHRGLAGRLRGGSRMDSSPQERVGWWCCIVCGAPSSSRTWE